MMSVPSVHFSQRGSDVDSSSRFKSSQGTFERSKTPSRNLKVKDEFSLCFKILEEIGDSLAYKIPINSIKDNSPMGTKRTTVIASLGHLFQEEK